MWLLVFLMVGLLLCSINGSLDFHILVQYCFEVGYVLVSLDYVDARHIIVSYLDSILFPSISIIPIIIFFFLSLIDSHLSSPDMAPFWIISFFLSLIHLYILSLTFIFTCSLSNHFTCVTFPLLCFYYCTTDYLYIYQSLPYFTTSPVFFLYTSFPNILPCLIFHLKTLLFSRSFHFHAGYVVPYSNGTKPW